MLSLYKANVIFVQVKSFYVLKKYVNREDNVGSIEVLYTFYSIRWALIFLFGCH